VVSRPLRPSEALQRWSAEKALSAAKLKRYELLSPIGTGGMGRVYRARIEGPAGASKRVAVKVMHTHLASDADFVEMFLDEMRVAMALDHRNIVQTFDADHDGDAYFMVMELVEGCSLRQLLSALDRSSTALPIDIAVFIGMEISAALDFAHHPPAAGRGRVLHRDISPSNILLASEGAVKLADFGVAKIAGGQFVTSSNLIRGKLAYMSPEQARGGATPQSDLYSLGAVLYEITTGRPIPRPPDFEGLAHVTLPPAPQQLRTDLPAALGALILRCLEPAEVDRIESATELRNGLAAVSFELSRRPEMPVDPHARLRAFLQQHVPTDRPGLAAGGANKLAQAVLAEVRALETDTGLEHSTLRFEGREQTPPAGSPEMTRPSQPARGRKKRWATALLLIAIAGALAGWLVLRGGDPPATRAIIRADGAGQADATQLRDRSTRQDATDGQRDVVVGAAARRDAGAPGDARRHQPSTRRRNARRRRARQPPRGFGYLDVNSVPWTRVYIDGRFRGETPVQRIRLSAGWHRLRLRSPSRKKSWMYRIRVEANKRQRRVFELRRR
jgi:serine/threonine protein kinase